MTKEQIKNCLDNIREVIDYDITDCQDISIVDRKMRKLATLSGLAAECISESKRHLRNKELIVMKENIDLAPSKLSMILKSSCGDEESIYVYSDRIGASITHHVDALRSTISLYKTELENSLQQ